MPTSSPSVGRECEPPSPTIFNSFSRDTWKCPEDLEVPEVELDLSFDDAMSWLFDQYNYAKFYGMK